MAERTEQQAPTRIAARPVGRVLRPTTASSFWIRRVIDLAVALPFLVVSLLVTQESLSFETKNSRLVASVASPELYEDGELHPRVAGLLPRLITMALPADHAVVLLGVLGALLAGFLTHLLWVTLWQEYLPHATNAILILALVASPAFLYLVVTNFPVILALTLFTSAVRGALRLAMWNDTQAGFWTGVALLLAGLSDPLALLCAAVLAIALPLLPHAREDFPGAKRANITVILFPLGSVAVIWILFELIFYGVGTWWVRFDAVGSGADARMMALVDLFQRPAGLLILSPFIAAMVLTVVLRHYAVPLGAGLVLVAVTGSYVAGLITASDTGSTFVVTMILAIVFFPRPKSLLTTLLMCAVLLGLLAAAWWGAMDNARIAEFVLSIT